MGRKKPPAKRRRRPRPQLTPEQRVAIELARRAAEQRAMARAERRLAALLDCLEGDHYGRRRAVRCRLDRWELAELRRMTAGRAQPQWSLPDSAYEARRLARYVQ